MRTRQSRFASVLQLRELARDYPPAVPKESVGADWSMWPLGVHPIDGAGMVLAKGPSMKGQSGTDIEGISAGLCLAAVSPKGTRYADHVKCEAGILLHVPESWAAERPLHGNAHGGLFHCAADKTLTLRVGWSMANASDVTAITADVQPHTRDEWAVQVLGEIGGDGSKR